MFNNSNNEAAYLYQHHSYLQAPVQQQQQTPQHYYPQQNNGVDQAFKQPLPPVSKKRKLKDTLEQKQKKTTKKAKKDAAEMDYIEVVEVPCFNKPKVICPKTGRVKSELEKLLDEPPHTVILKFNFQASSKQTETPQVKQNNSSSFGNIHQNMQIQNMISNESHHQQTTSMTYHQHQPLLSDWTVFPAAFNDNSIPFDGFIDTSNFLSESRLENMHVAVPPPPPAVPLNDPFDIMLESHQLFDFTDFQFI